MSPAARLASRPALAVSAALLALTLGLSGCATTPTATSDPSPVPAPVAEPKLMPADPLSGTGPSGQFPGDEFPIPTDARSLVLEFACEGGSFFQVEIGDSMALGQDPLTGSCDGSTELAWPISSRTQPTIQVWTGDEVEWVATPTFSTAEFVTDEALAADCSGLVDVYSAITNAEEGFVTYKAFGREEWTTRMTDAIDALKALAAASTSNVSSDLATISQGLPVLDDVEPGQIRSDLYSQLDPIGRRCAMNHTPLVVNAEFGG